VATYHGRDTYLQRITALERVLKREKDLVQRGLPSHSGLPQAVAQALEGLSEYSSQLATGCSSIDKST
jgi:hypothetical protein